MKKLTRSKPPLAEFLREKRIKAGLSQQEVAGILGYTTPQFVSNWERGVSNPPVDALKELARIYQVSLDEVFEVTLETAINRLTMNLRRKFYGKKSS